MTEEEYRKYKEERRKRLGLPTTSSPADVTPPTEPVVPEYTVTPESTPEVPQEVIDAYAEAAGEIEEGNYIGGTLLGVAGELGLGIGLSRKLHKSQKYLKWANGARRVAMAGIVTPEPSSTVAGVVGLAATEAAIWGFSNFVGQQIRQSMGLQDEYSAGEGIAASVFGVGIVTKAADKVFRLGPGIGSANAWKGTTVLKEGVETYFSGAALGLAESALRQEIEAQMNGKERNTYDYLFSGIAGGAFNTLFSVWGRTGKWGRQQANEAAGSAKERLLETKKELKAKQDKLKGRAGANARRKIQGEINNIDQAVEIIDDTLTEIKASDDILTKQEQAPVADDLPEIKAEDDAPILEPEDVAEIKKNDEELLASKDLEEESVQTREQEEIEEPNKVEDDPDAIEEEALPRFVDDEREDAFDALIRGTETYGFDNIADNRRMGRISQRLYERSNRNFEVFSKRLREDITDVDTIQQFLNEVKFLRKLNREVRYPIELAAGGGVQAFRGDSDKYAWRNQKASYANQIEDAAYAKLEADLEIALGKGTLSEDASILDQHNKYVEVDEPKAPTKDEADIEIDNTLREDEEFQAEKAEQAFQKKINTLQTELDELRATFGKEPEELAPTTPKEKDPRVKDLEDKIKFYKDAQAEVRRIKELEAERARLLEIETGPLGRQRAEVEAKPTGPKKAPGRVQKLTKDIADLRKNMRNRVREIDRARVEMSEQYKAEQLRKAYETKRNALEEELDGLRERFGRTPEEVETKPAKELEPELKELKDKINYYKQAEREIANIVELEKELARVSDIEGRSVMGELRAETAARPKEPTKPLKSAELRKKIADSKRRMRKKLADIDRAAQAIKEEELRLEVFKDMEDAIFKSMDVDAVSTATKAFRWVKQARQLALIDQLPSVLAGVPTGIGAVYKRAWKPLSRYIITRMEGGSADVAKKMAAIDVQAGFKVLSIFNKEFLTALKRSFKENIDVTDKMSGKLATDINRIPQGEAALLNKAYRSAKEKQEGLDNLANYFINTIANGKFMDLLSLGVRGIQTVDAGFKRQLIKGDIYAAANQKALLNNPKDSAKAVKEAEEAYKKAWVDDDGLEVLASHHEFQDRVDKVRQELLFAANTDDLDLASGTYVTEKLIGFLKDVSAGDGIPGSVINAFLPYIGVPIRAVYRGSRLVGSPALLLASRTKNNPYNRRLAEVKQRMVGLQMTLNKPNITPEMKQNASDLMQELQEESIRLTAQRTEYNVDILTDTFVATTLAGIGVGMAYSGMMTGSLAWLTDDQRQKTKLEPFKALNSDYSAALPWSFPLALGADVAGFLKIRAEEDATGSKILTKEQNLLHVIKNSLKELAKEMPLAQGARNFEELIDGDGEVFTRAIYSLGTSYFPYPAQLRKFAQAYQTTGDAAINDLRGGDYKDRLLYSIFGKGIVNKKTDYFGYDLQSNRTFMTEAVIRQAPRRSVDRTQFDEIIATDTHENIQRKPSTLGPGIKLTDFRDSEGMTLAYAFDLRLREVTLRYKGKKRSLEDAVYELINDKKWNDKFEQGFKPSETRPDVYVNEGLKELNNLMQKYYRETKKQLLKDKDYLYDFVGSDDTSLIDTLEQLKQTAEETGRPTSILELLTR